MKNTTFRKKALLSSVAMLLVALVALGSATFAWFSSNKTVTADGMEVTSAAAQGLVISDNNGNTWDNKVTFEVTKDNPATLSPVSIGYDSAKSTLNAAGYYPSEVKTLGGDVLDDENASEFGTWNPETIPTPATGNTEAYALSEHKLFAVYEVRVKSTAAAITNVTGSLTYTASTPKDASNYIRIAVIDESNKVLGFYGNEGTNNTTKAIVSLNSGAAVTGDVVSTGFSSGEEKVFSTTLTAPANNADDTTAGAKFRVLVWFEGQDEQCVDLNQQAVGKISLKFNY